VSDSERRVAEMTISYQRDVASSTAGGFTRLLFKWKGSLYKLICRELLLFLIVYTILGVIYRQFMTDTQKRLFESVVKYFDAFLNLIPLSFVLGFYVSYVASRWWQQFLAIPWPDKSFHTIACYIPGFDDESRMLRRSLLRWMNLALILVLRSISSAVKQRFPTIDHVVEAGFMTPNEKKLFESVPANEFNTYWVPCTWFVFRLQEATMQGKLLNQYALENIMREFCEFRAKCGLLWCYDWVSIPMVYTQVVTLATYVFFIFTIIGRQKLEGYGENKRMPSGRISLDIDLYIPIFTVLQFFFYMGLLKVAEQLINPFGDDDEDFELNWLIDRHVKASFLGCDVLMNPERIPPLVKDFYWDKQDCPIPYTEASMHFKKKTYRGSADDMKVPEDKCHMVLPEIEEENEDDDKKLSLTSLLLDSTEIFTNIGRPNRGKDSLGGEVTPMGYERSPRHLRHNPGAWRNGHSAGPGSSRDILAERFRGSQDSVVPSEEDDLERRGSIPFFSSRRGSRLSEIIQMQDKKKKSKRYKDKQGFTWRPFIPDEELPMPRAPHPHIEKKTELPQIQIPLPQLKSPLPQPKSPLPQLKSPLPHPKTNGDLRTTRPKVDAPPRKRSRPIEDTSIVITQPYQTDPRIRDPDTCSLKSTRSENSFKTASSDPQLNFIPRQVSDSYKLVPQESAALERKSSVRALQQQQYSALNAVNNNGSVKEKPNRTQNKSVR